MKTDISGKRSCGYTHCLKEELGKTVLKWPLHVIIKLNVLSGSDVSLQKNMLKSKYKT